MGTPVLSTMEAVKEVTPMKKAMCIAATAILVFSLAGCGETAGTVTLKNSSAPVVNEGISQEATAAQENAATLFSDSKDMTTVPETEKPAKMEAEAPVDDPGVSTEAPTETAKPQEEAEVQPTTAESPQPEEPESRSTEPTEPKPSEQPTPQETQPPVMPEPDPTPEPAPEQPPVETQPPAQTEPPATEPVEPAFSIDYWIAYAQGYAESVGLNLDSTATGCWDNPIVAGAHCTCLERDIQSRLNRYAKDDSILDVWIWVESRSDGSYDLYIGYA